MHIVASRPRFGCCSPARTGSAIQKVAEGSVGQASAGSHTSWSMPAVSLRISTETRPIRNSTEATDHVMHLQLQIRMWIRCRIPPAIAAEPRPARPCGNALVRVRRRIATMAVGFTRIPHSLSFAVIHLDKRPGLLDTIRSPALQRWLSLTLCPRLCHLFVLQSHSRLHSPLSSSSCPSDCRVL